MDGELPGMSPTQPKKTMPIEMLGKASGLSEPQRTPDGAASGEENDSESEEDMPALIPVQAPDRQAVAPPLKSDARETETAPQYGRRETLKSSGPGRLPVEARERPEPGVPGLRQDRSCGVLPQQEGLGGPSRPHQVVTDEQADELGYPRIPEEMQDPEYFKRDFVLMSTDPRYNKCLLMDNGSQEYWNEAARAPWAKVLLRREQYWNDRRTLWVRQAGRVAELNNSREVLMELLEECDMDVKRLVSPIAKYKIVELKLHFLNAQAKELGLSFRTVLLQDGVMQELQCMRKVLDAGGDAEAQRLLEAFDALVQRAKEDKRVKAEEGLRHDGRIVMDMEGIQELLNLGQKCKKDGLEEWKRDNVEEALASWRQGDNALKRFRAPARNPEANFALLELHSTLLKNRAQAAIRLSSWNEALEAAERAIENNEEDHKSWFRKAQSLEGLGHFEEASACLDRIQGIAAGRVDSDRIAKDVEARREKMQLRQEHTKASHHRMLQHTLRRGVFSMEREEQAGQLRDPLLVERQDAHAKQPSARVLAAGAATSQPRAARVSRPQVKRGLKPGEKRGVVGADIVATSRPSVARPRLAADVDAAIGAAGLADKSLTRDGADDLLDDLGRLYTDPWFVERVDKLACDMKLDAEYFVAGLGKAAFEAVLPVLEKWGFEASKLGIMQLHSALRAHTSPTRAVRGTAQLREKRQRVARAMYGSPYFRMVERVQLLYKEYADTGHELVLPAAVMSPFEAGDLPTGASSLSARPE